MLSKFTTGTWRTLLEILFLALILILLFRPQPEPTPAVRGTADSTFYWKNRYDQLVTSQKASAQSFSVQDAAFRHTIDSVAKVYGTQNRRIQELLIAALDGQSNLPPVPGTKETDTLYLMGDGFPVTRMRETFQSRWYTARVQLGDSSYLQLQSRDTMTALWKIVKDGPWYNREKYMQFDISFADTSRRVVGLRTFRRMETPREFSLNLETEFLFADGLHHLAGLGIERSARRFNAGVSLYKDLTGFPRTDFRELPFAGKAYVHYKLLKF